MVRQLVTNIWCDMCLNNSDGDEPVYTEATELPPITLGQMKPRVLALCDVHRKEMYDPFRELVSAMGQVAPEATTMTRLPGTSPGSGTWLCPDPECDKHAKPLKHEQSLRNHARDVHGMPLADLRQLHDQPALLPDEKAPVVQEAICPECGKEHNWPAYKRPTQALAVHRAKFHGVAGKGKAK